MLECSPAPAIKRMPGKQTAPHRRSVLGLLGQRSVGGSRRHLAVAAIEMASHGGPNRGRITTGAPATSALIRIMVSAAVTPILKCQAPEREAFEQPPDL